MKKRNQIRKYGCWREDAPSEATSRAENSARAPPDHLGAHLANAPREFLGSRIAYSPGEAAILSGVSRQLIYLAINRGELRSAKIGKRRVITAAALNEWLCERERVTTEASHG